MGKYKMISIIQAVGMILVPLLPRTWMPLCQVPKIHTRAE
jgi:hypothetical protein